MEKQVRTYEISLPDSENPIVFESGWIAKQANGSIWVRQGGTVVLVTAVAGKAPESYQDFFPLTVNYFEKMYSVGRIPGGYVKRETKPSDRETLTARFIDRPLRPLFEAGFRNETQVVATVLSADGKNLPDILALNAASAALMISDIPFNIAVGAVRIGKLDGRLVVNPPVEVHGELTMNIVVAGTKDAIAMVEAGMTGVTEDEVVEALEFAHGQIKKLVDVQEKMAAEIGKPEMEYPDFSLPVELVEKAYAGFGEAFREAFSVRGKMQQYEAIDKVKSQYLSSVEAESPEDYAAKKDVYKDVAGEVEKRVFREQLIKTHERADGRRLDEIRPIDIEVGVLPSAHGSALFTRGETQALVVATLGSKMDSQMLEDINGNHNKTFMLQYNFPPYSVGEVGRMGAPGRREIGHGALAERALSVIAPDEADFPYTVRIVSEILESNGSSSMATVCGGTLAMMDAGLQIKAPVAGVAMGLVMQEESGDHVVLTDIMGLEDHLGDMDFKVAGTAEGITALQMDIKIKGLSKEILTQALSQAKEGRLFILNKIRETLPAPRPELAPTAPRVLTMKINPEKTGALIGPQGKNIKAIIEATGATIDILDGGVVNIFGKDKETIENAVNLVEASVAEAVEGKSYNATVKKVMEYGAFVEILPGLEGLLHVSQYAHERIQNISDYLKIGDKVEVKYLGKDRNGRIDLSRKALLDNPKEKDRNGDS